jgi:hypothetical protein
MTTIKINGVTLSANASANGMPLRARHLSTLPGHSDFAERLDGRQRRKERQAVRGAKRSFLAGM